MNDKIIASERNDPTPQQIIEGYRVRYNSALDNRTAEQRDNPNFMKAKEEATMAVAGNRALYQQIANSPNVQEATADLLEQRDKLNTLKSEIRNQYKEAPVHTYREGDRLGNILEIKPSTFNEHGKQSEMQYINISARDAAKLERQRKKYYAAVEGVEPAFAVEAHSAGINDPVLFHAMQRQFKNSIKEDAKVTEKPEQKQGIDVPVNTPVSSQAIGASKPATSRHIK